MRKNLLITSALVLAAAVTSLAMADTAACGAAVGGGCQSGFFFGVEAKGASMRLRIKKDNKKDLESAKELAKAAEDLSTDEDALAAAIAAEKLEAVKALLDKVAVTGLDLDNGGAVAAAGAGALPAAAADLNGNVQLHDFTPAEAAALYEFLRTRGLPQGATAAAAIGANVTPILSALETAARIGANGAGFAAPGLDAIAANANDGVLTRLAAILPGVQGSNVAGGGLIVADDRLGLSTIEKLLKDNTLVSTHAVLFAANTGVLNAAAAAAPGAPAAAAAAVGGGVTGGNAYHINGILATDTIAQATVKVLKNLLDPVAAGAGAAVPAATAQKAVADKFTADYNKLSSIFTGGKLYDANGKALAYNGQNVLSLIETGGYIIKDKTKYLLAGAKNTAAAGAAPVFARGTAAANTAPTAGQLGTLLASGPAVDKAEVLVLASEAAVATAITATKDSLKTSTTLIDTLKASELVKELTAQKLASNKAANEANKATNAKNKDFGKKLQTSLADGTEHNSSLMGGVGAIAGYRHVLGQFAVSARVGADYLWGGFRTVETDNSKTDDKIAKLGFGVSPAIGVHFLASPSAELGLVGGVRFGQLQARKIDATKKADDNKGDYTSKWIWMPFVQGEATVWFAQNISGSVFAGYNFAVEQKFDKEGTTLSNEKKDAQVKVDGIFGGFRVAYHF